MQHIGGRPRSSPECLILDSAQIRELLREIDLERVLEDALASASSDTVGRFRHLVPVAGGAFHVVGGTATCSGADLIGLKVNGRYDTGRMAGTMLLVDARSGNAVALLDSAELTVARTVAMAGVLVRRLAPVGATSGLVAGTGRLAGPLAEMLRSAGLATVEVWGRDPAKADRVAAATRDEGVRAVDDLRRAARAAGVVVTATSSQRALLGPADVRPGALVVALGSDGNGKQELDPALLETALLVVDSAPQCEAHGELRSARERGALPSGGDLPTTADVALGRVARSRADETIVVDLTGIDLQDIATAAALCSAAQRADTGTAVRIGSV